MYVRQCVKITEKVSFVLFFESCYIRSFSTFAHVKKVTQNETIFWTIFKHCVSFHCVPDSDKKHLNVDIYLTEMEEG